MSPQTPGHGQIATDTLHLAANGNVAFTLVADKYAEAANIRGTIEFDTPPGGRIGALAFRIPSPHTFTTLPSLAKQVSIMEVILRGQAAGRP